MKLQTLSIVCSALSLLETVCTLPTNHPIDSSTSRQRTVWYDDKQITYYTQGPEQGPLLIFLHGWPAIAETWRPQIDYFSYLGFYVVSPDMPGYGKSTARNISTDYAHSEIVPGLLAMLRDVGRTSAVWIGHDWGAAVGSSLAAVHPEVVDAMAWLAVPYKTVELGYEYMLQFVNRTVYPEPEFHYAQWDYMKYYNTHFDRVTDVFETDYEYSTKLLFASSGGNATVVGQRSSSAYITADNGWFCGADSLPPPENIQCPPGQPPPPSTQNISLENAVLTSEMYTSVLTALRNTTFTPANAYYLNQQANKDYNLNNQVNEGNLNFPCLFIEARYDRFLDTVDSTLLSPMPAHCRDFTEVSLGTGHWVQLEDSVGTNRGIWEWLKGRVPGYSL